MSSELFDALNLLEEERGIPVDFMLDKNHQGHCHRLQKQLWKRRRAGGDERR